MNEPATVDCYINCWERTYREVLLPGFLGRRYAAHCFPFARRVLTINNVDNRQEVRQLADAAIARGDCDEYIFVEDELPRALRQCDLRAKDIAPVAHFVDFLLVAVVTTRAEYLLHVTADVQLARDFDWISDAVAALRNEKYLVANPNWDVPGEARKESIRFEDPYWVGFGFSDQCFLARASRLAAPIYNQWNLMQYRYPMAEVGRIFEARVDAHMRNKRLFRLTDSRITYNHGALHEGSSHPLGTRRQRIAHALLKRAAGVKEALDRRGRPVY